MVSSEKVTEFLVISQNLFSRIEFFYFFEYFIKEYNIEQGALANTLQCFLVVGVSQVMTTLYSNHCAVTLCYTILLVTSCLLIVKYDSMEIICRMLLDSIVIGQLSVVSCQFCTEDTPHTEGLTRVSVVSY